ncbi:unnamed protein product [Owenia fusiformis]|uniref:Uncharacterized protein n=1 Tax=Owenia fusiformis TaxID=6347 RepID=A0A8S4PHW9_OWEFU|nr:unnamed protein product [Owenia fusiformis]
MTGLTVRNRNVFRENIQTLPTGAFNGYPYLQRLTLDFEDLRGIETGSFQHLEHVRELVLTVEKNFNSLRTGIRTFQNGILSGLTSLKNLDASWIKLKCIEGNVFNVVKDSLQTLDLSYNNLGNINATCNLVETFSSLGFLQYLGLVGNNISVLKLGMFAGLTELRHLDISDNPISLIQPRVFTDLSSLSTVEFRQINAPTIDDKRLHHLSSETFEGLGLVKSLKLKNRGIRTLDNGTFNGLLSLKFLDLSQNDITVLEDGVFQNLTQLNVLILEYNMIQHISENALLPVPNINVLKLKENQIEGLPPIFVHTRKLRILDLRNNNIVSIPRFVSISQILLLGLGGNKLDCGCDINWIVQSVNRGNISLISSGQTLCSTPIERAGHQITEFPDQNKECFKENSNNSHNAPCSTDDIDCVSTKSIIFMTTEQTFTANSTNLTTDIGQTKDQVPNIANVTKEINVRYNLDIQYDLLIPLIVVGCISVLMIVGAIVVIARRKMNHNSKAMSRAKHVDNIRYYSSSEPPSARTDITEMVYNDTLVDGAYIIPIASSPEMLIRAQYGEDGYMTPISTFKKSLVNTRLEEPDGYMYMGKPVAPPGVSGVKAKREQHKIKAENKPRVPARQPERNTLHAKSLPYEINEIHKRQQKEDLENDYDVIYSEIADQDMDENKYLTILA